MAEEKKVEIVVVKNFKFAHRGCDVVEYKASAEPIEVTERCAEVAIAEKWAKPMSKGKKAASGAAGSGKDLGADQARAELQGAIAELEMRLAAAAEAEKPALADQLASKQQELAELTE